jgi:lysophospholipase-3
LIPTRECWLRWLPDAGGDRQVLDPSQFLTRDGDINQEDITNEAVLAWQAMPCFRFSLTDSPGVDHFSLPSNPNLLGRLLADLGRQRSHCG